MQKSKLAVAVTSQTIEEPRENDPGLLVLPGPSGLQVNGSPAAQPLHSPIASVCSLSSQKPSAKPPQALRFAGKTILIISGGTRGDVQPAAALGVALAAEGARVRLAADASFGEFVSHLGLDFSPLGGSARDMMELTVKWGGMLPTSMSGMWWLRGQIQQVMDSVWLAATTPWGANACCKAVSGNSCAPADSEFRPDLILANQLAYGQVSVSEKLGVPLHILLTIPWLPSRHLPHPWARAFDQNIASWACQAAGALLRPVSRVIGVVNTQWAHCLQLKAQAHVAAAANWLSTPLLDHTAWLGIADLLWAFRRRLKLPLLSTHHLGTALYRYPTACLFSPLLVPKPDDWPSHITVCGFLSLPDTLSKPGPGGSGRVYQLEATASSANPHASPAAAKADACILVSDGDTRTKMDSDSTNNMSRKPLWHGDDDDNGSSSMGRRSGGGEQGGSSYHPPEDLAAFIAAGPPPIYVGFGSTVVADPDALLRLVFEAAQMLQDHLAVMRGHSSNRVRLVVCSGWAVGSCQQSTQTLVVHSTAADAAAALQCPVLQVQQQQERHLQFSRCGQHTAQPAHAAGGRQPPYPQLVLKPHSHSRDHQVMSCSQTGQPQLHCEHPPCTASVTPEVLLIEEVSHEWLFPRCSALVHHGGVGTTAVGLKHGKPTLVIAAFGDLFFWGDMCHNLGVGPPALPLKDLTADHLFESVLQLVINQTYRSAAKAVAVELRSENGLSLALKSIDRSLVGRSDQVAVRMTTPSGCLQR